MKLLLVAATEAEIGATISHLEQSWEALTGSAFRRGGIVVEVCITGVGMMAATYALIKKTNTNGTDLALQVGVAGSFATNIAPGELVQVVTEQFGDLGAEDHYNFLDIFDLGLLGANEAPFNNKLLSAPDIAYLNKTSLRKARAITVNTVSGSTFTIKARQEKFNPDIESMEGLPFHYVCLKEGIPFAQVRSISNYVTPRDRESWKMKEAIINLNEWLIAFIDSLRA